MFNQIPYPGGGRITRNYLGGAASGATDQSVAGTFSLGSDHPSRRILVAAAGILNMTPAAGSAVGVINCGAQSVSGAGFLYANGGINGVSGIAMAIASFYVPTGSSISLSASFSASGTLGSAAKWLIAWEIYGAGSNTPKQVVGKTATIGIPAGGALIGAAGISSPSFTGIPTDGSTGQLVGASQVSDPEVAPFSITGAGIFGALTQWEPG
jgi:hypothetical protein